MTELTQTGPAELEISLIRPIPEEFADQVAEIYEEAFGPKFSGALWGQPDRLKVIRSSLDLSMGYVAVENQVATVNNQSSWKVLGIVGFQHQGSSLTGKMGFRNLLKEVGILKGLWALAIFSLFDRKAVPNQLVMDGIAVTTDARGKGIGTKLLKETILFAEKHRYQTIRLDVIGDNGGAKRLYQRVGFQVQKTESFSFLRPLLGFSSASEMIYHVKQNTSKSSL